MLRKKLLITGGLGNLGSWITQSALDQFDVTVLTRKWRKVDINGQFDLILEDLSDAEKLVDALKGRGFHYVIHAGSVNDSFVNGYNSLCYAINGFGTRNLINALDLGFLEHFVYLSTSQVYGARAGEIDECTEVGPKNDYAMSHILGEWFLKMDMPPNKFSTIRLTNSYGCPKELDSSKWYLVLNDLCRCAVNEKVIRLAGNGLAVRDFIWMGDVVSAVLGLLRLPPNNEIYNLSRGQIMSVFDIAAQVQSAYFERYSVQIPILLNDGDISEPDTTLVISSEKLRDRLHIGYHDNVTTEAIKIFDLLENGPGYR